MKTVFIVMSALFLFACGQSNEKKNNPVKTEEIRDHIAVLDFHTDHRCESCITIEKLTQETLNAYFKNELKDSTITFSLINVDAAENKEMAEEYEAFGTSLMISVFKNGEEDVLDLTEWAFEAIHGNDFKAELKKELAIALKKL